MGFLMCEVFDGEAGNVHEVCVCGEVSYYHTL